MSLPDYYKILQVPINATSVEIKAAYRRLAKMYHPDKNPGHADADRFKQIKEAYENLIDPQRRARYDAKRNRATTFSNPPRERKTGKKSYSFTEEEAKRRQYYQQHYKKTQAAGPKHKAHEPQKQQSELKYILISVPLAVALLLLIIRIYEKPRQEITGSVSSTDTLSRSEIATPEIPFKGAFNQAVPDTNSASVLRLVNRSGYDAIVFLQNENDKTVRHHFISDHYQLLAENMRPGNYHLYYWLGRNFSYKHFLFDSILGNFTRTIHVDSVPLPITVSGRKGDTTLITLENHNSADTLLLRRIFNLSK